MTSISSVPPLFIKDTDLESRDLTPYQMCNFITRVCGGSRLEGVQKINSLWRIYLNDQTARLELYLKDTVLILGKQIKLYDQNPYTLRNQLENLGQSVNTTNDKLTIKNIPLSVSNSEIKKMLEENKLTLVSQIKYSCIRDEFGQLTNYKNGDRFVYVKPVDQPIPSKQTVCSFPCTVIHHGKMIPCMACAEPGHRIGDGNCKAAPTDDIIAFKSYQHPFSNFFPCALSFSGKDFRSIEHALLWRMAHEMGKEELASDIMESVHAGVARRLGKDIATDEQRLIWEKQNLHVMEELLLLKAQQRATFKTTLLSESRVIAEASPSRYWGTGMSAYATQKTAPSYWPGQNMLGGDVDGLEYQQLFFIFCFFCVPFLYLLRFKSIV